MKINYNLHDLITICTDKSLDISEIELPDIFRVENVDDPDITIKVQKINEKEFINNERVGDKYRWGGNTLYLDWGVPSILNMRALIRNLEQPKTELIFSPLFWKYGDVSRIIGSTISIHLLRHNVTPVHAACISVNGVNILISGLSNMGKTSTILNLLSNFDEAKLYADDTLILGDDVVYSFPRDVGISPATDTGVIKLSNSTKIYKIVRDRLLNAPIISAFLKNRGSINLKQNIINTCKPDICYFLRDGPHNIQQLDNSVAAKLLFESTQTLVHYRTSAHHTINTYSYMKKSDLDLFELEIKRRLIIENNIDKIDCYEISSNKKGEFARIIMDHINETS